MPEDVRKEAPPEEAAGGFKRTFDISKVHDKIYRQNAENQGHSREDRYRAALAEIPAPGGGGCHAALLGVATLAIRAGRSDVEAEAEIRAAIPSGGRRVTDKEIREAIRRAHKDTFIFAPGGAPHRPIPPPRRTVAEIRATVVKNEPTAAEIRRKLIEAGGGVLDPFGADVWESSRIRLDAYSEEYPYSADMIPLLKHLYRPEEQLFIGRREIKARPGENIRTAAEWITHFERCLAWITEQSPERQRREFQRLGELYPQIMPNPLTGREGETKDGGRSFRADSCVAEYRYIVAEFDKMSFNEQGAILRGLGKAGAKIAAVIYSGSKSCHAWLVCEGVNTIKEWQRQVKNALFPILGAAGADTACSNPSRLSRLPGILRAEKGKWQRLLYLAPGGGAI